MFNKLQLQFFLLFVIKSGYAIGELIVDSSQTIVIGPGLQPNLVFPARYFYIIAVDKQGKNLTESAGDIFKVFISSSNPRKPCRIWSQVLDRKDGSYIVRYRLFEACDGLLIKITYNGAQVAQSPYTYNGNIYNEECYCPSGNLNQWQDAMQCPTIYKQIEDDLAPFPKVDMNYYVKLATQKFNHPGSQSVCNYVVLKNQIYRKCQGQHVGFKMFFDEILLSLARKAVLPDMELLINLGDWPLVRREFPNDILPMLSWCGSRETYDIVLPTYDLTQSALETMGRVSLDMLSVQANTGPKWNDKISKGFWRGRDSRKERLDLVFLAKQNPDLLNASLTNFFFFRELEEEYGPKASHISFFDFFQYKYQINIDGTVAAYRLPYLIAGDSVVIKQDSNYYEHFYTDLEPMVHFIPFRSDLSDLLEKIKWAKKHDIEAREIAQNGQTFARENLMPKDVFCYHAALFERFAKRISSPIIIRQGMEHVPQPKEQKCSCALQNQKLNDEL